MLSFLFLVVDGKCIFPSGAKQEPKEKRSKFEKTAEEETEPICPS